MKTTITILSFILFYALNTFAQVDSLPIRLAGVIYSADTTVDNSYVHIINKRTGLGTISDSMGIFKTTLLKSDTLIFRALGYKDKIFALPDTLLSAVLFVEIKLQETSYLLDVIDILALSRMNQFCYDFTNMRLPTNEWENQFIIPGVSRKNYKWIRDDERVIPKQMLPSPISAIYNAFSDREKSIKKCLELINNEAGDKIIEEKFNMKMLSEFTGFTGDTLIDFKLFLNFSRSFLLSNDAYKIFVTVKNKLPEFKRIYFTSEE
ncbi:MAG: hypothetical protein PF517_01915 [Salinivirgaceae bacterium]|nr:hypothetical protein [Salinivirgaceae bacterium]